MTTDPEITALRLWRLLHSHAMDAIDGQEAENAFAIIQIAGGVGFVPFAASMASGFFQARPEPGNDGRPCIALEVRSDHGYTRMVRVPAEHLGLDPDEVQEAIDAELDAVLEALRLEDQGVDPNEARPSTLASPPPPLTQADEPWSD